MPITDFPKKGDDKSISLRNSNFPQFDRSFAERIKEKYPKIWGKGGNIRGNDAFVLWGRAKDGSKTEGVLDWIKEREAWMARHEKDFRIAGVVAVMKWGGIVTRGESYMKNLINDEIDKKDNQMNLETKTLNFKVQETKQFEDESGVKVGIIKGLLATYGNVDRVGDVILPGAFTKSLERYRSEGRAVRMLFQHDRKQVIGGFPIDKITDTPEGLLVEGELVLESDKTRQIYGLAKKGFLSDMSIGYTVSDSEANENGNRMLKEIDLWEGSIVDEPANPRAKIGEVKNYTVEDVEDIKTKKEFEKFLRDAGVSRKGAVILASRFNEQRDAEQKQSDENQAETKNAEAIALLRQAIANIK
jgi:HK97 family phage prohead protease